MARLDRADGAIGLVAEWCRGVGLDITKMLAAATKREEIVEDILAAGIDPYWGDDRRLSRATAAQFIERLAALKRCIYDGHRLKLLEYDEKENVYVDRLGLRVEAPPLFADNELRKLRALGMEAPRKPKYLVASSTELEAAKPDKQGMRPLIYKPKARSVSAMDGYVDIDLSFMSPRGCEAKSEARMPTSPEQAQAHLNAYLRVCRASTPGVLCPPVFQMPRPELLFSERRIKDLLKTPFPQCQTEKMAPEPQDVS